MSRRYGISALAAIVGWGIGLSAVWADGMPGGMPAPTPSPRTSPAPVAAPAPQPEPVDAYTRAMLIGYAAAEEGDYQTALINFRRALAERPRDRYARAAIANMERYIAQQRAEEAKRQEIAQLQTRLQQAVEAKDWACAAATVDRLITLVPPDSSDRNRLIGYRGELAGFLNARSNLDKWSTVCPGTMTR